MFYHRVKHYCATLALVFLANCDAYANVGNADVVDAPNTATENVEKVGEWQFAIGLGLGQKTSVVYDQDDRNLYIIPSIKYYGERVFFDNGTLGYTFFENRHHAFSAVVELNPLVAQFKQYHPDNIFNPTAVSDSLTSPSVEQADEFGDASGEVAGPVEDNASDGGNAYQGPSPTLADVPLESLDWSVDAGLQHNWFISDNLTLITELYTDISSVHSGSRMRSKINWALPKTFGWQPLFSAGLHYIDDKSSQYYFGIDARDTDNDSVYFSVKNALNTEISVTAIRPLSNDWSVLLFYRYEWLDSALAASPLITDDAIKTYFIGLTYAF